MAEITAIANILGVERPIAAELWERTHKMSSSFQLNHLVRLKGLNNAAFNGKLAKIMPFPSGELCCNGRYRVELIDEVAPPLRQSVDVKPENMEHACKRCHKGGEKLLFCAKCKHVRYCDRECQRIDWERHKKECGPCGAARDASKNPLYLAILDGNLRLVQKLVKEDGIDVNMSSKTSNSTALQCAAALGHLPIVQYLLQQGADKDKADKEGTSPLLAAATEGHLSVVQYLLEQGANKDQVDNDGRNSLFMAAMNGYLPVLRYLLEKGADKDKATNNGVSPLFIAAAQGNLVAVRLLLEQGADVNRTACNSTSPLHAAAYKGHAEVVSCLLSAGASLSARDSDGDLPIDVAANEEIKQLIRAEDIRRRESPS